MWVKGQSGNPAGRAKKTKEAIEFEAKCQKALPLAFDVVASALRSDDFKERQWAADSILDRSLGKPLQRNENDNYNHDEARLSDAQIVEKLKELQAQNVDPATIGRSAESAGDSGVQATA